MYLQKIQNDMQIQGKAIDTNITIKNSVNQAKNRNFAGREWINVELEIFTKRCGWPE